MKKFLFSTVLVFLFSSTYSQFKFGVDDIVNMMGGTINTDRPGQAMNADPAGMGVIQIQTGFNYTRRDIGNISPLWQSYRAPFTIKLGILPAFELNSSFAYSKVEYNPSSFNGGSGITSPDLGFRLRFMKGDGIKPTLALQANLSATKHKGDFQQEQFGSSFYLVAKNNFGKVSIATNLGVLFPGNGNNEPTFNYVLNLGIPIGEKAGFFIEGFGVLDSEPSLFGDMGFSYLATKDLQFDIFGGWLSQWNPDPFWFVEAGISWRYSVIKKIAKKKLENLNPFGS